MSNVQCFCQDDTLHVRVCDFGFSRVKDREASRGLTKSDLGPIKWTSPEAMRERSYSTFSDVFSFGVVLYELFVQVHFLLEIGGFVLCVFVYIFSL